MLAAEFPAIDAGLIGAMLEDQGGDAADVRFALRVRRRSLAATVEGFPAAHAYMHSCVACRLRDDAVKDDAPETG